MRGANHRKVIVLLMVGVFVTGCSSTSPSPTGGPSFLPSTAPSATNVPGSTAPALVLPSPTLTAAVDRTATPTPPAPTLTPSATPIPTPAVLLTSVATFPGWPGSCVYVVVAGDTLWAIAQRHDLTLGELVAANPQLSDPTLIRTGDRVQIPPSFPTATPASERPMSIVDLTSGPRFTEASGVNNAGQVIGYGIGEDGLSHGFVWHGGKLDLLPTVGGSWAMPTAINERGQIVGSGPVGPGGQGVHRGYLWQDGTVTEIAPVAGCAATLPHDISDAGQVVGQACHPGVGGAAFAWQGGRLTLLDVDGVNVNAEAISADGRIVGHRQTAGGSMQAFVLADGVVTDLPTFNPGRNYSVARDINASGLIVGSSDRGWRRAVRWHDGAIDDIWIPTDPLVHTEAVAVNDAGRIVGFATLNRGAGPNQAVVWDGTATRSLETLGTIESHATGVNAAGVVSGAARDPSGAWHAVLWVDYPSLRAMTERLVADKALAATLAGFLDDSELAEASGGEDVKAASLGRYRSELLMNAGTTLDTEAADTLIALSGSL